MHQRRQLKKYLTWLLLAMPSALVAAVGVFLAWGQAHMPFAQAAGTGETVDFRMTIPFGSATGPPPPSALTPTYGCNTATLGNNDCGIPVNGLFHVQVFIDAHTLKNNDAGPDTGYIAVQVTLNFDTTLALSKNRTDVTELGPAGSPYWPECNTSGATENLTPKGDGTPRYTATCQIAVLTTGPESTHTGLVMDQEFFCLATGGKHYIELKTPGTLIRDDVGATVVDPAGSKYLTVLCLGNKGTTPSVDSDSDGCTDVQEQGGTAQVGGLRNRYYFWDFYDTPDAAGVRDKAVNVVGDLARVAQHFGANDAGGTATINRNSYQLTVPPAAPAYHPAFDRAAPIGPYAWDLGPPDGFINVVDDLAGVTKQFGHTCE